MKKKLGYAILYLSDAYAMTMALGWILGIVLFSVCAVFMMLKYQDTSLFNDLSNLITIPATAGGSLWLLRCCVNHLKGSVTPDFPNPDDASTVDGIVEEKKGESK